MSFLALSFSFSFPARYPLSSLSFFPPADAPSQNGGPDIFCRGALKKMYFCRRYIPRWPAFNLQMPQDPLRNTTSKGRNRNTSGGMKMKQIPRTSRHVTALHCTTIAIGTPPWDSSVSLLSHAPNAGARAHAVVCLCRPYSRPSPVSGCILPHPTPPLPPLLPSPKPHCWRPLPSHQPGEGGQRQRGEWAARGCSDSAS